MKKLLWSVACVCSITVAAQAQKLNVGKLINAGKQSAQALTLTNEQVEQYAREYIASSDKLNEVCADDDPYAQRLEKIAGNFNNQNGINIKVYRVVDVNAFACADGSVRVFAGLMDIMSDEEILGVIGHELGHVYNKDSRDAMRQALLNSAMKDAIGSAGDKVAALTDSQLGAIGEALLNAKYSQKQEYAADEYGYNFLKDNSVNPWAMAISFEKLQQLQSEGTPSPTSKIQQLFSTHPDLVVRTERMAEKAKTEGYERP